MKIEVLGEFIKLVQCQSYTRAAQELYLSQSNLSAHIKALEQELGFDVVEHGRKTFALTPAGMEFLGYAQTIVDAWSTGKIKGMAVVRNRPVRVSGVLPGMRLFRELQALGNPAISFLSVDYHTPSIEALAQNETDLVITSDFSHVPSWSQKAAAYGIVTEPVGGDPLVLVVSRANPLSYKKALTREDLRGSTFTVSSYGYYDLYRDIVLRALGENLDISFRLAVTATELDSIVAELGSNLYMCGGAKVTQQFGARDDVVIFTEVDGCPLEGRGVVAYRDADRERLGSVLALIHAVCPIAV